jgi:DNA topoisomerase I
MYVKRKNVTSTTIHSTGRGRMDATEVGFRIIQSMRKYIPSIVSTDLTRSMEERLDKIESGKVRGTLVIENAIDKLKRTMITFKEKEIEIGRQITEAVIINPIQQQMVLGTCPMCSRGILKIIRSRVTRKIFVGCSNYSSGICKATAPLPQKGSIQTTAKKCASCRWPIFRTIYAAKHPWEFCINIQCPSKKSASLNQHEGLDIIITDRYMWN